MGSFLIFGHFMIVLSTAFYYLKLFLNRFGFKTIIVLIYPLFGFERDIDSFDTIHIKINVEVNKTNKKHKPVQLTTLIHEVL